MIIIEGPDSVGKTTLAHKLLRYLSKHVYAHFTRLPLDFDYYHGYINRISPYVVQDRFHVSEVAYSYARGEKPKLLALEYSLVDSYIRLMGGFIVLITAEKPLITQRWEVSQMYSLSTTLAAAAAFEMMSTRTGPWFGYTPFTDYSFHCDVTTPFVPDDVVSNILTAYEDRQMTISKIALRKIQSLV